MTENQRHVFSVQEKRMVRAVHGTAPLRALADKSQNGCERLSNPYMELPCAQSKEHVAVWLVAPVEAF